jgi:hypothetical protein
MQRQDLDIDLERRRAAITRNYTTPAVIVLILYFVLYVPGLVANIVYLIQASNDHKLTGRPPEGRGCLIALIIVFGAMPIIGVCIAALIVGGSAARP